MQRRWFRAFTAMCGASAMTLLATVATDSVRAANTGPVIADEMPAGRSSTRLPDGRWLLVGGHTERGALSTASLFDPATQSTVEVPGGLVDARAWHSATLLSTGQVLIVGGLASTGEPVATEELFDPDTETFMTMAVEGVVPRARHAATLLTDGLVLISGGTTSGGVVVTRAELLNPDAQTVAGVVGATQPRMFHSSTLLADGTVLLTSGIGADGEPVTVVDRFDPRTATVAPWNQPSPDPDGPPRFAEARPYNGATNVPIDAYVSVRVTRPVDVDSVTAESVALTGPHGQVSAVVFAAEDGRLIFLRPHDSLEPSTTYNLAIAGVTDRAGVPLAASPVRFTTTGTTEGDLEFWVPDDTNYDHTWVSHRPPSPWQTLAPLRAEPGVTAVSGQVLTLDGRPLPDVTIAIDETSVRTDATGRFLLQLERAATARKELLIDGRTANRPQHTYGLFEYGLTVIARQTTVLPFTVWMPLLDTAHQVAIPSPTPSETVITSPYIPGLELHLPAGTVIRDEDGAVARTISITPIPVDRPPFPLAKGVDVPVYFTIQPGSAYVETPGPGSRGAWLVYPNYHHDRPGQRLQFFHYDAEDKGWYVYGLGTVGAGGAQVIPDETTRVYELTGAMINDGNSPPNLGATPGGVTTGDPVDPSTGVFLLHKNDLTLPDVIPIELTRIYNSGDSFARPFGTGMTHPYAMFLWSAEQYQEADLVLPEGGRIHFVRTSPGTSFRDAVFVHHETPSSSATPTPFYKSVLRWNGDGWDLTLTDGTVYVFGENAPLQAIRDRFGNTLTINRVGGQRFANIERVTSPNGRWIAFTYDANNRVTEVRDNIGRTVRYSYDARGNLSTVTDPENNVTSYTFTAADQLATMTDGRGIVFLTNRYENGRIAGQTLADPAATYEYRYTVDRAGSITQTDVTDPRGHVEHFTFNADHYLTSDVEALGTPEQRTTTFERQPRTDFVTATIDGLGRRTEYALTELGYVGAMTQLAGTADANTRSFSYESRFNQLRSITDPLGHVWTLDYDGAGHPTGATNPLSRRTQFATDGAGNITRATDPLQNSWVFGYDGGDPTSVSSPTGGSWTRFLDGAGRALTMIDPIGRTTRTAFDRLNRVTSVTDASDAQTTFSYDPNGRVVSVTDPSGHATSFGWDASDRLQVRTDPMQHADIFRYDTNDNLVELTDRNGQVTSYQYDALDRPTLVTYADGSTIRYGYDAGDRVVEIADSVSGTVTRQYDLLDRLTSETTPEGTVTSTYDADGRRTSMTVGGQPAVTYAHDAADHLTSVARGNDLVSMTYDEAGRRSTLTLPNGVVATYGYDAAGHVASMTHAAGTNSLGDLTYTYDSAGNRVGVSGTLARAALPPALVGAVYDTGNRLTDWGGQHLTYDANGNLLGDGVSGYSWNARGQLTGITGTASAAFHYDAVGRRRRRIGASATSFVYDGANVVQELSGGVPAANLLNGGLDEVFQRTTAAGSEVLIADALGSTTATIDASAVVRTEYVYEAFGQPSASGVASTNRTQFAGRESEGGGLYYFRARYYDARRGRFISEDPFGLLGGDPNLYAYVRNRPTQSKDPFGLYNADVHFDLTKGIGIQVGMCAGDAEAIAHANQWVDDNPITSPMPVLNVKAREMFHFTSKERREQLRKTAFDHGWRDAMGVYLHALQDSFSHQRGSSDRNGEPFQPYFGHAIKLGEPDNPRKRPDLWRRMQDATARELWQFHQTFPSCRTAS